MDRHFKSHPLSVAQTGMWVKEKLSPPDLSFVLAEAIEILGPISPDVFCNALQRLSQEVDVTRIQIVEIDGKPRQIIAPYVGRDFDILDFSANPDGLEKAYDWMRAELARPLDLGEDGLWSSALIKIKEDHWIWYHRVHHILFDGFTGGLLARRQAQLYTALKRGEEPEPCDFGSLQELLDSEENYRNSVHFERDRTYWLDQMRGISPPVTLTRHSDAPSGGLLRLRTTIGRDEVKRLQEEAKKLGASLPQALIATVASYYARATDCSDLTMVTMVTGRISSAVRRIPGMVANAVPLRFNVTPDISWQDMVKQASSQMMRALRYQRYRYEDIRRDLNFTRQDEQLARLGVNIEPFDYDLRFDGHAASAHNLSNGTMTDFTIFAYDRGDGGDLHVDFDANPALYTLEELEEHKERFLHLISNIISSPDRAVCDISLLLANERQRVLNDWNDTAQPIENATWLDLFRRQVEQRPHATAVIFEARELNYEALDKASDLWAAVLKGRGIGRGHLVAIATPRSEQMLIALLAVAKTGAAYLPLDPSDPRERLSTILEDAMPSVILSTSAACVSLPALKAPVVLLDEDPADVTANGVFDGPEPQDTAYVIFTSGSTGRPKGVEIAHASLLNFLQAMQKLLSLKPEDRIVAVTTIAFDISALELFLPLTVGATTVITTRCVVKDPTALYRLIKSNAISIMQATPSLWRMLLSEYPTELKGLRPLVGGEALPRDLARRMEKLGHPVINLYGPTETTVWSACMPLTGSDLDSVPIGKPICNTQLYVLDRSHQPVPPGSVGELYIGGAGVAKGYLNRPELTQERFLPNPFRNGEERMYRTGDLARWRADGVLEYLGRNDHQIKIRGFRVEPGEIEAAIISNGSIRQAVVVLREDNGKSKQLVAYLTPAPGRTIDTQHLANRLAGTLPPHMIPAVYVVMEDLPLNTNGKIDRNALPIPQVRTSQAHVAPSTDKEILLARLWCDILELETISIHDDFFQLGGDSLSAASMISALSRKIDGDIAWSSFVDTPTIASFAKHLDNPRKQKTPMAPVLPIRAQGNNPPLFCIHPVMGLGLAFTSLAQYIPQDVPIFAFQADGLNKADMPASIEEMARLYLSRIRDIQPDGPYNIVGWSFGGLVAHELARQMEQKGDDVAFLALLDSYPFMPPSGAAINDETVLAKVALGFLGFDENIIGDKPAFSALGDFLTQQYGLRENIFFKEILRENPAFLERLREVIMHHLDIAQHFVPGRINADIHFFSAKPATSKNLRKILNYHVEAWLPHAIGGVHRHELDCAHEEMLEQHNAEKIAAVFMRNALSKMPHLMRRRAVLPSNNTAVAVI
ncbi:putative non-ribosomal peptide synthetase [Agrobacterium rubi TR3 = NBRC 13261]|uniref:Putative non-ribosomal peptide synthetase n=1 Tax=Agrobacterium rubi TR3 = NBRC 13261 TaxID=1368415 RepID=A0A081D112_9HYPH|nr:non-ribosomal peptide synthetase [Agrobacterium rubi]MBP1881030.1 enterobactin synthetase component F [Agrobacterium rubi]MCL6650672.1 non-ribosomal peptide synthetase [Agrobacterium rubi]GAK72608.1 putative non-ribosomal peptide synthetase [Agrobacterium rubi TR3 = NBRC 13261]